MINEIHIPTYEEAKATMRFEEGKGGVFGFLMLKRKYQKSDSYEFIYGPMSSKDPKVLFSGFQEWIIKENRRKHEKKAG